MYVTRGVLRSTLPGNEENVNFATNTTPKDRRKKQPAPTPMPMQQSIVTVTSHVADASTTTKSSAASATATTAAIVGPTTTTTTALAASYLGQGLFVDARDAQERWNVGKVLDLDAKVRKVLIHFVGWNARYDEWLPVKCVAAHDKHTTSNRPPVDATKRWDGKRSLFTRLVPNHKAKGKGKDDQQMVQPVGHSSVSEPLSDGVKVVVNDDAEKAENENLNESLKDRQSHDKNSSRSDDHPMTDNNNNNKRSRKSMTRKRMRSSEDDDDMKEMQQLELVDPIGVAKVSKRSRKQTSPTLRLSVKPSVAANNQELQQSDTNELRNVKVTSAIANQLEQEEEEAASSTAKSTTTTTTTAMAQGPKDLKSQEAVDLELELDIKAEAVEKPTRPRRKLQTKATKKMRLVTTTSTKASSPGTSNSRATTPSAPTRRSQRQQEQQDKQRQEHSKELDQTTGAGAGAGAAGTTDPGTNTTTGPSGAGGGEGGGAAAVVVVVPDVEKPKTTSRSQRKSKNHDIASRATGPKSKTTAPAATEANSTTLQPGGGAGANSTLKQPTRDRRQNAPPRDRLCKHQHDALDANSMATKEKLAAIFRLRLQQQQRQQHQQHQQPQLVVPPVHPAGTSQAPRSHKSSSSSAKVSASATSLSLSSSSSMSSSSSSCSTASSMAMAMAMTTMPMAPGGLSPLASPHLMATSYAQQALYAATAGYFANPTATANTTATATTNGCLVTPMMAADAMDPRTLQTRLDALEQQKRLQQQHVQEYLEQIRLLREQNLQRLNRNNVFLHQSSELWAQQQQQYLATMASQLQMTGGDRTAMDHQPACAATGDAPDGTTAKSPGGGDGDGGGNGDNDGDKLKDGEATTTADQIKDSGNPSSGSSSTNCSPQKETCTPSSETTDDNTGARRPAAATNHQPKAINAQTGEILYEFVL